jgi:hypothetical protein
MTKTVQVQHFDSRGDVIFIEKWKLRIPLTGNYKTDKSRLKKMMITGAHENTSHPTKTYVVTWGDCESFLMVK